MSLLVSEGFPYAIAQRLPLATLWSEVQMIRQRIHERMATEAILLQAAVVDVLAGGENLSGAIEDLRDG